MLGKVWDVYLTSLGGKVIIYHCWGTRNGTFHELLTGLFGQTLTLKLISSFTQIVETFHKTQEERGLSLLLSMISFEALRKDRIFQRKELMRKSSVFVVGSCDLVEHPSIKRESLKFDLLDKSLVSITSKEENIFFKSLVTQFRLLSLRWPDRKSVV